jgi:hypothetical protein
VSWGNEVHNVTPGGDVSLKEKRETQLRAGNERNEDEREAEGSRNKLEYE